MFVKIFAESPVQPISPGDALKISLDNYYDLLKGQVGNLQVNEYLQLKLVADILDVSADWPTPPPAEGAHFYPWYSNLQLLNRADKTIVPIPLSAGVETGGGRLSVEYGKFLQLLRKFVVQGVLSKEDQQHLDDYDGKISLLKDQNQTLVLKDRQNWKLYADAMGFNVADSSAYIQWAQSYGHLDTVQRNEDSIEALLFQEQTILDKNWPDPDDKAVVDASVNFNKSAMRLRYPMFPDYQYTDGRKFNPGYLGTLPLGSTAQFDDRLVITTTPTLDVMKTAGQGTFDVAWDRSTQKSTSISTDWSASASGGWGPFGASVSTSESAQINQDFNTLQSIELSAAAAFRAELAFPAWFDSNLFNHKHVKENIQRFLPFFGKDGTLLYFPTGLILVRGFSVKFISAQNWTYDYKRHFSASGSGGFNCLGYRFGASANYNSDVHEHQVDQANTKLQFSDDTATIRFVGYAVKKVTVAADVISDFHRVNRI